MKPRTIITADPELDDLNSLIRLLLNSNDLVIEGLVYASSRFHWKGDGAGTPFFLPGREYDEPQTSWRWAPGERFIDDAIDAYAEAYANLVVHDPEYPHPDRLRGVVRDGNIRFEGEMTEDTPGSRLIEEALLDDVPGPLHLQVWAGTSTVARALQSIEHRYRGSPEWDGVRATVSRRAVITKFASQDETYDDYIRQFWPAIRVTDVAAMTWGYLARRVVLPEDQVMLGAEWMREHVTSVGALGALYRVWGDGRQMVEGDRTDYFHLSGYSADELGAMGYTVWMEPQGAGEWISEGDTTNMLNLLGTGLRGHEHPSYGGWGGRADRTDVGPDTWSVGGALDEAPDGTTPPEYPLTRWFAAAQRDFVARLRWSVTAQYADAGHHPVVTMSPGVDLTAAPGETVTLTARTDHPDGRTMSYRWWHYVEAGTCRGPVPIAASGDSEVVVRVPVDAVDGQTLHVVLEVQDDAEIPLTSYQRVIVTVQAASE